MANDKLEDFILNNRGAFDDEAPTNDLWNRIESSIQPEDEGPDALDNFVTKHRDAFDSATPPPRLEGRIFAGFTGAGATPAPPLQITHRRRNWTMLGVAASALLLIVASFLLGQSRGFRAGSQDDAMANELQRINPDYLETEQYYQAEIAAQFTKVKTVNNDPQLVADLEEIDRATAEIRASLLEVPESQRPALVEEMIRIYRTKLDILVRVQRKIPPGGPKAAAQKQTQHEL